MNKAKNKVGRPKLNINEEELQEELRKYIERKTNSNNYFSKFKNWENFVLSDFERQKNKKINMILPPTLSFRWGISFIYD